MSDTNRFNRDSGVPSLNPSVTDRRGPTRHLGVKWFGFYPIEWDEEPFEWVRPFRFAIVRRYTTSPVLELNVRVELHSREDGGTHLIYSAQVKPRNILGTISIPVQIGILTRREIFEAVRRYDAEWADPLMLKHTRSELAAGGRPRLSSARAQLVTLGFDAMLVDRLFALIEFGDELELARIRPYALADFWASAHSKDKSPNLLTPPATRTNVLELCLHGTRLGVLDLEWDLLCPLCRGAGNSAPTLGQVQKEAHCPSCNIDYEVNFDRSVELTFHPNPAVRQVETRLYCVGGPQVTPHIFAQHLLPPRASATISLPLEPGRYRLRTPQKRGGQFIFAKSNGVPELVLRAEQENWGSAEPDVSLEPHLIFENATHEDQLFILERWAWSDQSVTAADVTALQTFRDLFANEALRSGEQFSVGGLTLVFTDLKRSTELYREIGDAPAFGRVLNHFQVIRDAVVAEEGSVVKTMGDAVMAVFRRPVNALRAMQHAQEYLANPPDGMLPLALKVGIHSGTCIAVTLNSRLDYFGSNVNIAARVASLSSGTDILLSETVWKDHEVERFIGCQADLHAEKFETRLRGYDDEFSLWRLEKSAQAETIPQFELAN